MHILPNISQNKGNQTLQFGQVTEISFFENHAENEVERLLSDLFLNFKKALYEEKANDLQLSFNHFR